MEIYNGILNSILEIHNLIRKYFFKYDLLFVLIFREARNPVGNSRIPSNFIEFTHPVCSVVALSIESWINEYDKVFSICLYSTFVRKYEKSC